MEGKLIFQELILQGAYQIDVERYEDERGFFARSFCQREFEEKGLIGTFVQCNLSFNHRKGTLRGMHWQEAPHAEAKLVRCLTGSIFDVILDVRPMSPTFGQWVAVELSAQNR